MSGNIFNSIINLLINSIPEGVFWVSLILIRLNRYEYLIPTKTNFPKFLTSILIPAIISAILRFFSTNINTILIVFVCVMYITIMVMYKLYGFKKLKKLFLATLTTTLVFMIIELLYMPIILYATNRTIAEFNMSVGLNFLLALPERIIQYIIVSILFIGRFKLKDVSVLKSIYSSKVLFILSIGLLLFNIGFLLSITKMFVFDRILQDYSLIIQCIIIKGLLLFPIVNLLCFWSFIYNIKYKEKKTKEELSMLTEVLSIFREYNLNGMNEVIKDIKNVI